MTRTDWLNLRRGLAFASLWLVGLGLFTAYPIIASLYYSFCDYSILQPAVPVGLANYAELLHDPLFYRSLFNTFAFALLAVPLGLAVALGLALLLAVEVPGVALFRTIFYLPAIIPLVASSMLWLWIFNGSYGILNVFLGPVFGLFGAAPPTWLADPEWAKPALALMSLWGVGNSMIIFLAGVKDVPRELYEAAIVDGAGVWGRFRHVTLPLIMPVLYFNLIMGLIGALQTFTQVFIMAGPEGGPAKSTLMYALYLFTTAFFDLRLGYASALAWILFLVIVALTVLAHYGLRSRLNYDR